MFVTLAFSTSIHQLQANVAFSLLTHLCPFSECLQLFQELIGSVLYIPFFYNMLTNVLCFTSLQSEENAFPTVKHCLDGFANGSKIGKLQIRKGGRMELSFCGMPLDVTCGVATRFNEVIRFSPVYWLAPLVGLSEFRLTSVNITNLNIQ